MFNSFRTVKKKEKSTNFNFICAKTIWTPSKPHLWFPVHFLMDSFWVSRKLSQWKLFFYKKIY